MNKPWDRPPTVQWLVVPSSDRRGFDRARMELADEGYVYVGHEGDVLAREARRGPTATRKEPDWYFVRNL